MNTIHCAAALACALCAAGAQAQSAVTLYGRLDMNIGYQTRIFQNGRVTDQSATVLDSGGFNGSRWGLRVQEDLGDGLKAVAVLESGVQADTGVSGQGGRLFGRQAYVGLESASLGRVTLGRQYTPWFDTLSASDPFGNNLVGNAGNLEFANSRVDNAVLVRSPTLAGFTVHAMVAAGEGATGAGRQDHLALHYQNESLWVGAAYGDSRTDPVGKFWMLGAAYKLGPVKLFANTVRLKDLSPVAQAAPVLAAGARGSSSLAGASMALGGGTAMLSYVRLDDRRAADRDARQYAVGYVYPLSRRTSLYAAHARVINRNGGVLTPNTPSYPGRGEAQSQLGISHAF